MVALLTYTNKRFDSGLEKQLLLWTNIEYFFY